MRPLVTKENLLTQSELSKWPHLRGIEVEEIDAEIEMLIGMNVPKVMEPWQIINSQSNGSYAVKTLLGWVVNGPLKSSSAMDRHGKSMTVNRISMDNLKDLLLRQYNQEFPEKESEEKKELSCEDRRFMELAQGSKVDKCGHYILPLPFREKELVMPNNYNMALQRTLNLAGKFKKNCTYAEEYKVFMENVLQKGYAEKVPQAQVQRNDGHVWYIPHHGVYHKRKRKLRVVFDCSSTYQGKSNHLLLLKAKLFCKDDIYSRKRWKQVQYIANLFWQRWIKEYLPLMQQRQKWTNARRNFNINDVVVIVDETAPRNSWPLGRVVKTLPGPKGLVRSVLVKTKTNTLQRPIDVCKMAAHTVAVARGSPLPVHLVVVLMSLCLLVTLPCHSNPIYSRHELILIGLKAKMDITSTFTRTHNISSEIARPPGAPWIVIGSGRRRRRRRERRQKRGCRGGLLARLRNRPHRPPLPSIFLANARSLANKMDELQSRITFDNFVRECCLLIVSESWLRPHIPDATVELAGRTIHRHDRTRASGKAIGGGLCVYVLQNWCSDSRVIDTYCSPDLEAMSVQCRPFYLPREITAAIITAVYIPPDANVSMALGQLQLMVAEQQRAQPDGIHIIAGDFNKANLKTVLPKFHQHGKCATRGKNTLDHVYSNIKHAYRATPLPHLGQSDHLSLFLFPAYTPPQKANQTSHPDHQSLA